MLFRAGFVGLCTAFAGLPHCICMSSVRQWLLMRNGSGHYSMMNTAVRRSSGRGRVPTSQVDAVMRASRALVGIAAASIADVVDIVTVPQLRVLVMVATRGPLNLAAVAAGLDVSASNASRICDRLLKAGLLDRRDLPSDRRHITLTLTEAGQALVDKVLDHRRSAVERVLRDMSAHDRKQLAEALDLFATAAGEPVGTEHLTLIWPQGL
jgi:DNA-binding MarR family transcriptional regulator